ncbi:MAG TPA: ribosome recycling factor [Candidatus Brocadiia bacterium]|nr:ribosome recycling factor [Candidatus Brocadiia bacterium]
MDLDEVMLDAEDRMEKTVNVLKDNMRAIRTGRATPGLVDTLKIPCYGGQSPLKQVASIGVPEPQLIVIKPYDLSIIADIEKAIMTSELGLNPQSDGRVIRLVVPPLSEDRRKSIVNRVKDMGEDARVSVRNIRRDANRAIDKMEKDGEVTEDERDSAKKDVQEFTDKYEEMVNQALAAKTKELMEV